MPIAREQGISVPGAGKMSAWSSDFGEVRHGFALDIDVLRKKKGRSRFWERL
jgi:hypothetical protein